MIHLTNQDALAVLDALDPFADGDIPDDDAPENYHANAKTAFALMQAAIEHGLLKQKIPSPRESCGEGCTCAEYFSADDFRDGQVICYERTALLRGIE